MSWAAEHVVGVAQGSSRRHHGDLRANFQGVNALKLVCILQWLELLTERISDWFIL